MLRSVWTLVEEERMLRRSTAVSLIGFIVAVGAIPSEAGANTWNLIFKDVDDNTNIGFDDPTTGARPRPPRWR
jgi:hypothetical protein